MTQILPYILAGSLLILTVVLAIVGVQLFLVLKSFRQAIDKVNHIADETETKIKSIAQPLQGLVGIAAGVKTGVKVFEGFVSYLNKKKEDKKS